MALEDVGLIETTTSADDTTDRYGVHDLLHEYAHELFTGHPAAADDRQAAFVRQLEGYYGCVNAAFQAVNEDNPLVDHEFLQQWPENLGKRTVTKYDVRAWIAVERPNLIDLVTRTCASDQPPEYALKLAFSLFYFLEARPYWPDWKKVTKAGSDALDKMADQSMRPFLLRNQARIDLVQVRDWCDQLRIGSVADAPDREVMHQQCRCAISRLTDSLELRPPSRLIATVYREIADCYLLLGKLDPNDIDSLDSAIRAYEGVRERYRQLTTSQNPLASLCVSLSEAYRRRGQASSNEDDYRKADCVDDAIAYAGQLNDKGTYIHPQAYCFGLLRRAELYVVRSGAQAALPFYKEAADAFQADNNWLGHARTLATMGRLLTEIGQSDQARLALTAAHDTLTSKNQSDEAAIVAQWRNDIDANLQPNGAS